MIGYSWPDSTYNGGGEGLPVMRWHTVVLEERGEEFGWSSQENITIRDLAIWVYVRRAVRFRRADLSQAHSHPSPYLVWVDAPRVAKLISRLLTLIKYPEYFCD